MLSNLGFIQFLSDNDHYVLFLVLHELVAIYKEMHVVWNTGRNFIGFLLCKLPFGVKLHTFLLQMDTCVISLCTLHAIVGLHNIVSLCCNEAHYCISNANECSRKVIFPSPYQVF